MTLELFSTPLMAIGWCFHKTGVPTKPLKTAIMFWSDSEHVDILAEQGTTVSLSCSSPRPWFFCVWEGPRGGRVCGLRTLDTNNREEEENTRSLCGESARLRIGGQMRDLSSKS